MAKKNLPWWGFTKFGPYTSIYQSIYLYIHIMYTHKYIYWRGQDSGTSLSGSWKTPYGPKPTTPFILPLFRLTQTDPTKHIHIYFFHSAIYIMKTIPKHDCGRFPQILHTRLKKKSPPEGEDFIFTFPTFSLRK